MEHYGITEIANLFGISTETIRKYEKKGILNTERILNRGSLEELETDLRIKKEEAARAILKFQSLFRELERCENSLHELHNAGERYRIEYSPAMYAVEFSSETSMTENEKLQKVHKEWIQNVPFVSCCAIFGGQDAEYRETLMVVDENCSDWIDKEGLKESLRYIPSRLSVCLILGAHYGGLIEEELRKHIRLMADQGYKPDGDIIAKIILMQRDEGVYYCNHKAWVPVKLI